MEPQFRQPPAGATPVPKVPAADCSAALQFSEQRFLTFVNNSPAIAWMKDSALRYVFVSKPYERMIGRTSAELIGRDDFEVWPAEMARILRAHDDKVLATGRTVHAVEPKRTPDGRDTYWLVVKFLFPDASGAAGVAGNGIDITEQMQAAEEIHALLRQLITIQEAERKRLAGYLHDLVGQNLSSVGLGIRSAINDVADKGLTGTAEQLAAIGTLVRETAAAVRGVMADLYPPELEQFGLAGALSTYATSLQATGTLQVNLSLPAGLPRFSPEAELALFRIAQEALTNIAKHSGSPVARLAIGVSGGEAVLTIEDRGKGIPEEVQAGQRSRRGGWGLPTMRERAEALGGSLNLTHAGIGTIVTARIPETAPAQRPGSR
jgi:PAS domain S-box-containing protein